MEILNILTIINANTKFNKKSKIEDVKQQLLVLENLLNLKWPYQLQGLSTEELDKRNRLFDEQDNNINYCLTLYIDNYKHLSTDKKLLNEIKKITIKIKTKYLRYFSNYNYDLTLIHS